MRFSCKVKPTHFGREGSVKEASQMCSMRPHGPTVEQCCFRPPRSLEQNVRKRRVHSLPGNLSPAPSRYSELVPLRHHKCVAGVLPGLVGYGFWEDETESLSRIKRSRGFSEIFNSDLKLPPLAAHNDKVSRAGLMVRGSSCLRVSTFPPIHGGPQVLERPPSRAGRRELDHPSEKESTVEGEAQQSRRRTQPLIKGPSAGLSDPTRSKAKLKVHLGDHASEKSGMFKINLGINLQKSLGGPAGLRPLKLDGVLTGQKPGEG
ncbi:uncharacterized protein LOC108920882 [Scleropages formosus]|uniref:uncharacterized protein LOC108920882 n=1 Tax=Scleropages formosus TaxID=113540 RepID=UPI0010FA9903|nr:uncharacterized protein LOC108920882 [Scleropages formosus]